jgi:hypothetical protein
MKSFVTYPLEFQPFLFPTKHQSSGSGKLIAHYELFKKIAHLNGSIIKCGITAEEGFTRFAMFKEMAGADIEQTMIAFQKHQPLFEEEVSEFGTVTLKVKGAPVSVEHIHETLKKSGINQNIQFVPGAVCESIPEFLIENPELKIALLNVDLDEYDGTMTSLEFLYPRLVSGGILILDNYYKHLSEYEAVNDYFHPTKVQINNFSVDKGPHYIIKP